MASPAILSVLLGMVLAQRFKVFILLPIILLVLTFAFAQAIAHVGAATTSAIIAVIVIVSLQLGYVLGIAVRHARIFVLTHRLRTASLGRLPQARAH